MENVTTGKLNGRQITICWRDDNFEEQKDMVAKLIVKELEKMQELEHLSEIR